LTIAMTSTSIRKSGCDSRRISAAVLVESASPQYSMFALPRLNRELVLFGWKDGRWAVLKSWPVPTRLVHRDRLEPEDAVASATDPLNIR
jgi:hypothetical protein